jgi:acyl carrier protein
MSVEADIKAIIKKKMTNKEVELTSDSKLAEIGLDSLDFVEIVFEIEDKYKIQLPQNQEEMANATLKDLCGLVEQHIASGAQMPSEPAQQPA